MKVYVLTSTTAYETWNEFLGVFPTAVDAINFLKENPRKVGGGQMDIYETTMSMSGTGFDEREGHICQIRPRDTVGGDEWIIEYEDGSKESLGETVWDNEKGEIVWERL